jgi:SAM-dependent methyltransferase
MGFYLRLTDYWKLYRLARARLSSEDDYRVFQHFQGQLLLRFLKSRGVVVSGRRVADVGCGYGGYSLALRDSQADVFALDRSEDGMPMGVPAVVADALALPLESDAFDVVICASLIEHVARPERLLADLLRITRPGGVVYLSFPPFYSPGGGHQFSPFHYLGEHNAVKLARRWGGWRKSAWVRDNYPTSPDSFVGAYGAWGLYPLTIRKVEGILREVPFRIRECSTRLLPLDFSGIPLLRELLTWHVQYLLEKPIPQPTGHVR